MKQRQRRLTDREIAGCFNSGLGRRHRVRLIGGADEPVYLAAADGWSVIRYTRDYPASVLHELAHWCVAGRERRCVDDYGYWYVPPPRSPAQQSAFERVEIEAQALECRFAAACGLPFLVSVDDPDGYADAHGRFERRVLLRAAEQPVAALPRRAQLLLTDLQRLRGRR